MVSFADQNDRLAVFIQRTSAFNFPDPDDIVPVVLAAELVMRGNLVISEATLHA
jgi:hypothetical protein